MIRLNNPLGGYTWVHESRLDEYLGQGFSLPTPPQGMPAPAKQQAAKKKSTAKK